MFLKQILLITLFTTFFFQSDIEHEYLSDLINPIRELYADVKRKALMRLEYEGLLDPDSQTLSQSAGMRYHGNATAYAMERYAYYVCHKCNKVRNYCILLF